MCTTEIAILVIAYKRSGMLKECIERLQRIGVGRIYVAADGAKTAADVSKVDAVRNYVKSLPPGIIYNTRFASVNHGCREWVSSSINWFFESEDFGIIVEEDILIDSRFYEWCRHQRDAYVFDERVMHINAFYPTSKHLSERPAHFTKFASSWGWATWRRAWRSYDDDMSTLLSRGLISRLFYLKAKSGASWIETIHYFLALQMAVQGKLSSWAYRWNLTVWDMGGVALSPGMNLSENVGVGEDATHTSKSLNILSYPVAPPDAVIPDVIAPLDREVDRQIFRSAIRARNLVKLVRMLISTIVPNRLFFAVRRVLRP